MTALFPDDEALRAFIPNILTFVKGETPLVDRINSQLSSAERWVERTFISPDIMYDVCDEFHPLTHIVKPLVATEAMIRAIPSLDLVLTPNGFGVVSSQNIAPASKPRIDRLMESLRETRDELIAALLVALKGLPEWHDTPQAAWFGATLCPDLGIIDALGHSEGSKWERYAGIRLQLIDLEATLAEEYVSAPLMDALRSELLRGTITPLRRKVVERLTAQLVHHINVGAFNARQMADIVNLLRHNPEIFPEWHSSPTAQLYAPPKFVNQKKASGYFF